MTYLSLFNKLTLHGEGSIGSFHPDPSIPIGKTILAIWECKTCKHLYIDPVANPNSLPTPPATECADITDEEQVLTGTNICQYERLSNFGSIDLTDGRPCSAPVWEILRNSEYWNGVCTAPRCANDAVHCRCDCVLRGEEVVVNKEESNGVGRSVVMVGSFLAVWGGLVAGASVL